MGSRETGERIEATMRLLDQLDAPRRERVRSNLAALQAYVTALDVPFGPVVDEEEPAFEPRRARPDDARPDPRSADELPFGVSIAEGREGHALGRSVRAKLIRQALEKSNW